MKLMRIRVVAGVPVQPPSGGCVLKLMRIRVVAGVPVQPPSGGCVLKQTVTVKLRNMNASRLRAAVC